MKRVRHLLICENQVLETLKYYNVTIAEAVFMIERIKFQALHTENKNMLNAAPTQPHDMTMYR